MPYLAVPSEQYKDSFLESIAEFHTEGRYEFLDTQLSEGDFQLYIQNLLSKTERNPDRPELVPESILWLIDDDEYIGRVSIRHKLNERSLIIKGNFSYDIRPSKRMRGYGTLILKLAIVKARELGLDRALVACDVNNIGSRKCIESNGGVLENEIEVELAGEQVLARRYWIKIEK